MQKMKVLVFDLGNVVFECSFDEVMQSWSRSSGKTMEALRDRFQFDFMYEKHEKGEISANAYFTYLSKELGLDISIDEIEKGWNAIYGDLIQEMGGLLKDLKLSYRIVALTNTNRSHKLVWEKKYADVLREFEKIFSSHEIGARKPDEAAYRHVLRYLNLPPGEVVFLDDNLENVEAGSRLGMKGIHVRSFQQMRNELIGVGTRLY